MAAQRTHEAEHQRRRRRLLRSLLTGSAAVGVPALVNSLVARRARLLPEARWGSGDHFAWRPQSQGPAFEVAYQRLGDGPPLVLAHSLGPGHSSAEWRAAAELLAAEHEIFALDLLGWGSSDRPKVAYTPDLYLRLLADFLDRVVGRPAVLLAAGATAAYAVKLATLDAKRFLALGLLVPWGLEPRGPRRHLGDRMVHQLLRLPVVGTSALNLLTSRRSLVNYLRRETYASPELVDDALIDNHYRDSHQHGSQGAMAAYLSGELELGVGDLLPRLDLPVWVVWGRQAVSPPVETSDLWLRLLPRAELEVLERCGTLPHAESPGELCRKLELFLSTALA